MTGEQRWFVSILGDQEGPITRIEVERRIRNGEIARGSYVYGDGMKEWMLVEETDEFGSAFKPASSPPPPPPPPPPSSSKRSEGSFIRGDRLKGARARPTDHERPAPSPSRVSRQELPRKFRRGSFQGTARDVQVREVTSGWDRQSQEYLSFRLELTDASGNVVDEVPVEVRGENIPGRVIRDGDTVAVRGRRSRRGLVNPKGIYVVSTKAEIKVKRHGFIATILSLPLGLAFLLAWPGLIVGIFAIDTGGGWLIAVSLIAMLIYYVIYIR